MTEQLATTRQRALVGVSIAFFAIICCLLVGLHYDLYGNKIDFIKEPATYLFFGFIFLSVFGVLYILFKTTWAFFGTLCAAVIYLSLFFLGKFSRGEL